MNRAFADTVYRIAQQLVLVGSRPLVLPMPRRRGSIKFDANLAHGENGHAGYPQRHQFTLEFQTEHA
jgi:hypothetical protein